MIIEFVKNADSIKSLWLGLLSPFCLSLFGDNRSLRFMCVDFGWRTFFGGFCYEKNYFDYCPCIGIAGIGGGWLRVVGIPFDLFEQALANPQCPLCG